MLIWQTDTILFTLYSFLYSSYPNARTWATSTGLFYWCVQITFSSDMRVERLLVRSVWEHSIAGGGVAVSPRGCHRCQPNRAHLSHSESPVHEKGPTCFKSFIVLPWSRYEPQHISLRRICLFIAYIRGVADKSLAL
jgi:hypothetical protein